MASIDLTTNVGRIEMRTPLVAASGTVGSVWEWASVADVSVYGAATAKSVSGEPWEGRPPPRIAPADPGMLNGIGIQNPGIDAWLADVSPKLSGIEVPVWGSAVGNTPAEFARVASGLAEAGVSAIEVNLSCPNLEEGRIFAMDPRLSSEVTEAVANVTDIPFGVKLSPASEDIVSIAKACVGAGAEFLTLTNTAPGFGIDIFTGRPKLSGGVGGYSGPGLKALSLRCVYEVAQEMPDVPIVGCGGVSKGRDVIEYLMAGASAVGLGTIHLATPKAGRRILSELRSTMKRIGARSVQSLVGTSI